MKKRIPALVLALCLVLTALPICSSAAALTGMRAPAVAPMALPAEPVRPQADTYTITMACSGPGVAELYATTAGAREYVYFLADPEPGYRLDYSKSGYYYEQYKLEWAYIGSNMYVITMPDGDVMLNLEFVPIESDSHDVTLTVSEGGIASVDQSSAKKGESLFVEVIPTPGYTLESVKGRSDSGWNPGYYLGKVDGVELYEIFMPDEEMEILVTFKRNGPYAITPYVGEGGTVTLSHETAYELETVTITATPDTGFEVESVQCYHSPVTRVDENTWTFPMPKFKEEVHVSFRAIVYPAAVTVETGLGGTAVLDTEGAVYGQTVTLTCTPEEGYRIAQITGVEELTELGGGVYTFPMPAGAVEVHVLFLRENNPFLDVNEKKYYHDPVLWAVENGITNGIDDTHFGPNAVCNRAQVVTFLWRAAGSPEPQGTDCPFTDVPERSWYTKAVLWAVENGITNGLTADTFGPTQVCNRGQVVTFLWRAHGSAQSTLRENPFTDVSEQAFYYKAVLWAVENGVTTGASAAAFNPAGQCLRAQVVTFLYRADQIPEPAPDPEPFPDLG